MHISDLHRKPSDRSKAVFVVSTTGIDRTFPTTERAKAWLTGRGWKYVTRRGVRTHCETQHFYAMSKTGYERGEYASIHIPAGR